MNEKMNELKKIKYVSKDCKNYCTIYWHYNDSSDYINDILATFIKKFKEITIKLGIEYE